MDNTIPCAVAQSPVLIPCDPDIGRLATVRPAAVDRVRRQMTGSPHPLTVDRLLSAVSIEPPTPCPMWFRIDGEIVRVCITDCELHDIHGNNAASIYKFAEQTIYLSTLYPRQRWPRLLRHELAHSWFHLRGRPISEEQQCHALASFWLEIMPQYEAQGGDAALMRLPLTDPDDLVEHPERFDCCS